MVLKRTIFFLFLLFCLLHVLPASAADIYGRVWLSPSGAPAKGAKIYVDGDYKVTVDKYGRYRLSKLTSKKNCKLKVSLGKRKSKEEVEVYSGTGSKSMNIELRFSGNNKLILVLH